MSKHLFTASSKGDLATVADIVTAEPEALEARDHGGLVGAYGQVAGSRKRRHSSSVRERVTRLLGNTSGSA